jgi:glutaryl-CoA dehydrogenase
MVVRLSQQQDSGVYRDQDPALAKAWTCSRMRETVAAAREIAGGNGVLLEHAVARFFADAESVYTYEGTKEINTRSSAGLSPGAAPSSADHVGMSTAG